MGTDKTAPSLERIYPDKKEGEDAIGGAETVQLHFDRYRFAGENATPGIVADVACGAGYGSFFLANTFADKLKGIVAVDIDEAAIGYATEKYAHPLIRFFVADAAAFDPDTTINTIVSLETIEHLPNPQAFVRHWAGKLPPGGRFIASAPITPSMDANPYHLQDFSPASFRKLFTDAGLKEIKSILQVQRYRLRDVIGKNEESKRSGEIRKNLPLYYLKNPGKFFLRLRSVVKDGFTNKYAVIVFEKPY